MNKNNIEITVMTPSDLAVLKSNFSAFSDNTWNFNILEDELKSKNSILIIAKIDKQIIGFAGIKIILDEAELMNIITQNSYRHNGIASRMLDYLIDYCKKEKIKTINLEVNIHNSIAINLYKKYNFNEVGLRKKYYNKTDDALLMTLKI